VCSGEKRKRAFSPHESKGKLDVQPRASQVITNVCSLFKSAVAGNRTNKQRVVPEIDIHIAQHSTVALLDTGSEVSCISEEVWAKLTSTGGNPPTLPALRSTFAEPVDAYLERGVTTLIAHPRLITYKQSLESLVTRRTVLK
jgi:hypothetical protein